MRAMSASRRLGANLDLEGAVQPRGELAFGLLDLLHRIAGRERPEHGNAVAHDAAQKRAAPARRALLPTASNSAALDGAPWRRCCASPPDP